MFRRKRIITFICIICGLFLLDYLVKNDVDIEEHKQIQKHTSYQSQFQPLKVPGLELYIYSAISTNHTDEGFDIRIIAVNGEQSIPKVQCCFKFESSKIISVDATWKFHFGMSDYKSTVFSCKSQKTVRPSVVTVSQNCTQTNGATLEVISAERPSGALSVCVHAVYGYVNPELIVEWMEMLMLQGVQRVFVYPVNQTNMIDPRTLKVFQYYSDRGLMTLLPYTLAVYDKKPRRFQKTDGQMYNDEILPVYDCLARSAQYTFTAVIDFDELIIPERNPLSLLPTLQKLYNDHPDVAFFSFTIENFVMNWTATYESELIIMRYQNRTRALHDRVKIVYVQPRYHSVGMHTSDPLRGYSRVKVPSSLATVHHYTYCRERWTSEMCMKLFPRFQDDGLLQLESRLRDRVNRVPHKLRHG